MAVAYDPSHDQLVRRIAAVYWKRLKYLGHYEYADLVGAGMVGLCEAYQRFDESRGATFKSYSAATIRGRILDFIRDEFRGTRTQYERGGHDLVVLTSEGECGDIEGGLIDTERLLLAYELAGCFFEKMDEFTQCEQIIFYLCYIECRTLEDAAVIMCVSVSSAHKSHQRLLLRLKKIIF